MLKDIIKNLPEEPGIYLFKNEEGKIIYIGKAKNLKKRVSSYFQKNTKDIKTELMREKISDINYVVTRNEFEAILLENSYIKQYKPKYNILLKDDKSFPYIEATVKDEYPGIYVTRNTKDKKAIYFGPYIAADAKQMVELIYKIFKIRQCPYDLKKPLKRACIYYDMNLCLAPCIRFVSDNYYLKAFENAYKFLKGNYKSVIEDLKEKMNKYAENQEYEKAAQMRDYIKLLESNAEKQRVVLPEGKFVDVINYLYSENAYYFCVLKIRDGRLINKEIQVFKNVFEHENVLNTFIIQYYSRNVDMPFEVWVPDVEYKNTFTKDFMKKLSIKILFKVREPLIDTAMKNIISKINEEKMLDEKNKKFKQQIFELQRALNLEKTPVLIDGIDISHIGGTNTVGSCVVFKNGIPEKNFYRRYKIKQNIIADDYAAIKEVVQRRYSRIKKENGVFPDLILIDGGIGQVNMAADELKNMELKIEIIGIAKKEELVFMPYKNEPIKLEGDALLLLKRIRDEAHRFALAYQTKLSEKAIKKTVLNYIPFIGEKTRYKIYNEFNDLNELIEAIKNNDKKVSFLTEKQKMSILNSLKEENKK
jgi:excinuclease ABC subunit C